MSALHYPELQPCSGSTTEVYNQGWQGSSHQVLVLELRLQVEKGVTQNAVIDVLKKKQNVNASLVFV